MVAQKLRITTTTLYAFINGDGSPKETAHYILKGL
jgi:hypothetical protein